MHPRYSRPAMVKIWAAENRFRIWCEIECLVAEAQAELGLIPKKAAETIRKKARFDVGRISEIEKETHHDVIAFLTNMAEHIGEESRFVHQGLTSSDVLDTALSVQLKEASDLIDEGLAALLAALKEQALTHRRTAVIGRSHGMYAEPLTFGLKLASHYAEFARHRRRLSLAKEEIAICAISGAVGTHAHIAPDIQTYVAEKLGLGPETISTQIIPRDRHAVFFSTLGVMASSLERLAVEIRHLQRSEVAELEEPFGAGQKGSSAMPHKRNPVLSENVTGLTRLIRSFVLPALENVALWHERDISHSSVERVMAPDATVLLDFALARMCSVVKGMRVRPDAMQDNLARSLRLYASQRVLLALTESGLSREQAYRLVQNNAMRASETGRDFIELAQKDQKIVGQIGLEAIAEAGDIEYHIRYVDHLFARVFGE